ncbi:crotonobetainyl-CoA--carnitine CoA-transferase [Sphingomonas oleivorans]|uniref:Crotonobetainyl-CoA--carnitine CoA-transferase n=1 Tax=Sphingomonas oleivorans TaxID=1735121 RepID=A0A2T5FZ82_9SPHN|nr:DUF1810 family protein [Sphingomonas oleivorans]PTQ11873.1 crotonobetainyl-CoA--carnitine CoA-transferase [Sphingomonas oleivorans]
MNDEYNLQRFLTAQAETYDDALDILRRGVMCTPYMDFIFPRFSSEADGETQYSISSLDEATAYLDFPILGNRYRESVETLFRLVDSSAREVFGEADARKLHASLTLFSEATNEVLLRSVLAIWFDNMVDEETMIRIGQYN